MANLLTCNIVIEGIAPFQFAHEIIVIKSYKNLTDTATLTFPRNVKFKGNIKEQLKVGAKIKIYTGYNGDNHNIFTGYITRLKPQTPFSIEAEDEMWKLKQTDFSKAYSNVDLRQLLSDMLNPYNIQYECLQNINMGKRRFEKMTVAKVLASLKSDFGIYCFFIAEKLYVGTPYMASFNYAPQTLFFGFQKNIIKDGNELEYTGIEDRKIKVEAISIRANNKMLKVTVGDPEGEVRTLHYYDINSEVDLKNHALSDMNKLKVSGYKGSFLTYGNAYATHGMTANIHDNEYPERAGEYKIEAVQTTWGIQGYKQKITLGSEI